ncbi:MAG: Gfo/Idh/MocA family oxidoreductase [Acidobacteria bacterium]|nr:Gfo/Idh/MocA family oxidoreductase [Acidobacteriota bacterium]
MRKFAFLSLLLAGMPAFSAEPTIAVVGLVHSHVWGHLNKMIQGKPAKLAGVAETAPDLIAEAQKRGVPADLITADWKKMIDEKKPTVVWAFVENNRHLEIVEYCAPRKIHVIFEKPLASTYKDALAIKNLAATHGIYILCNYQMAWWPSNFAAKEVADSGQLGDVWRIRGIVGHGGPGGPTGLNKHFFNWLTDPVKNGAGALVDFGCYNALWSLMYLGRPETVYAQVNKLRPEEFPKVEDNATIVLHYPKGVAVLEGSWDLPRSFQDLEIFGRKGSVYATSQKVELRLGRTPAQEVPMKPLPPSEAEPIAYMLHCIETKTAPKGMTSIDLNAGVVEIIEAAKESVKTGRAVSLKK